MCLALGLLGHEVSCNANASQPPRGAGQKSLSPGTREMEECRLKSKAENDMEPGGFPG